MASRRILIVDDQLQVCQMMESILSKAGFQTESVQAPLKTVASLLMGEYDLLAVDLRMPDMDGQDVAELARVLDRKLPVVVVSGFLTPEIEERFRAMGIEHFLRKPFVANELLETFESAMSAAAN